MKPLKKGHLLHFDFFLIKYNDFSSLQYENVLRNVKFCYCSTHKVNVHMYIIGPTVSIWKWKKISQNVQILKPKQYF